MTKEEEMRLTLLHIHLKDKLVLMSTMNKKQVQKYIQLEIKLNNSLYLEERKGLSGMLLNLLDTEACKALMVLIRAIAIYLLATFGSTTLASMIKRS